MTQTRLETANIVLGMFSDSRIEKRRSGWYVVWKRGEKTIAKRWMCRGQDFYPVWSRQWPNGGTASTALSQLIRWLRGQPVLPLASWRYWASDRVALVNKSATDALLAGGYPEHAQCVLCGGSLKGRDIDWWHLDGVSGPCCGWTTGCRQKCEGNVT